VAHGTRAQLQLSEKDLRQWDLLAAFRQALARQAAPADMDRSWSDRRRTCGYAGYLSLFLFGLFNPALETMRALCAASRLPRVQREVSGGHASLGSFSEAQHLTDPGVLERVFGDLVSQVQGPAPGDVRQAWQQWFARDSSLFAALPRMSWALHGAGNASAKNNAVRLHLSLHLLEDRPARMQVTAGKVCERKVWKETWETGAAYVGDRYFAENYRLLGQLEEKGCRYVLRLRDEAVITVEEELPLSEVDRAAGVQRQAWARLGSRACYRSVRVRVVWIGTAGAETLRLVTNVPPDQLSAAEVGLLYRRRWQIECFFRWIKCLLGCRHWLAESQTGVTIQLYLALIAAVLFQLHTGRRPNKRMMELFQLHQLGWATTQDLMAGLEREQQREQRRKTKTR
jgi:Transposase DDE domain